MSRPRILLPLPTSANPEYNVRAWPGYASATEQAGGEPVRLELNASAAQVRAALRSCAGAVLPGSPADMSPARFGARPEPETAAADTPREEADWTILEEAERSQTPVLGICYGVQSLNVYCGGTLIQDLSPLPVNHAAGRSVSVAHTVEVLPGSVLAAALAGSEIERGDGTPRLAVNSSHHQAVGIPGSGLRVTARCPQDGVIEAVEREPEGGWFLLGVQWHPERSCEGSEASRALFRRLIAEARKG